MYVRWLGAFRKGSGSLTESVEFEFNRHDVVAVEKFRRKSEIKATVGLLVDPTAVYKDFQGDVWSEYTPDGTLEKTRYADQAYSAHKESWARPVYTGLVIKNGGFNNLKAAIKKEIRDIVHEHNIPVYKLSDGRLIQENIAM